MSNKLSVKLSDGRWTYTFTWASGCRNGRGGGPTTLPPQAHAFHKDHHQRHRSVFASELHSGRQEAEADTHDDGFAGPPQISKALWSRARGVGSMWVLFFLCHVIQNYTQHWDLMWSDFIRLWMCYIRYFDLWVILKFDDMEHKSEHFLYPM